MKNQSEKVRLLRRPIEIVWIWWGANNQTPVEMLQRPYHLQWEKPNRSKLEGYVHGNIRSKCANIGQTTYDNLGRKTQTIKLTKKLLITLTTTYIYIILFYLYVI